MADDDKRPPIKFDDPPGAEPEKPRIPQQKKPFEKPLTSPWGSTAQDIGLSSLSGLAEGASGILGLPAATAAHGEDILNWVGSKLSGVVPGMKTRTPEEFKQYRRENALIDPKYLPSEETAKQIGEAYGPAAWYQAQPFRHQATTLPGEYAHTIFGLAPGLLNFGARVAAAPAAAKTLWELGAKYGNKAIDSLKTFGKYAAAPGVASETAGQLSAGTPWEPWLRGGAALTTGVGAAVLSMPNRVERTIAAATGGKVTAEQLAQAEELFQRAREAGLPMTRATAVQYVTGGATNLGNLQRYAEGTGRMTDYYADTPQAVERIAKTEMDKVGAPNPTPTELGPTVMNTARAAVAETPQGKALAQADWQAGPPLSPGQAGEVIQPELAQVEAHREGMRHAVANEDFDAARRAPARLPVEEDKTQSIVRFEPVPEPHPLGRVPAGQPGAGQIYKKSPEEIQREALRQPEPIEVPRDERGRMIKMSEEERAAAKQQKLDELEQKKLQQFRQTHAVEEDVPVAGSRLNYVQADPTKVAQLLESAAALEATGSPAQNLLKQAHGYLFDADGKLVTDVTRLQNARESIKGLIEKARGEGDKHAVDRLSAALGTLDRSMEESVPEIARANRNFQANSRALDAFAPDRAPGQIIERREGTPRPSDQLLGHNGPPPEFQMRPEQVPGAITAQGTTGVRDFQSVASPAAREAYEHSFVNEILNSAGGRGIDVSADSIRKAISQNEDLLRQMPGVRAKLEAVAAARESFDTVMASPLGQLAKNNTTVKNAVDVLFRNPNHSEGEIASALSAVKERSPKIASDLVQHYLRTSFNQFNKGLQTGANQWGGASWAAGLRGNAQLSANLDTAIRTVYGDKFADGFGKMLDMLQATGARQRTGSPTAFYQEIRNTLEGGGWGSAAVEATAAAPAALAGGAPAAGIFGALKIGDRASRAVRELNRTGNLDRMVDLFTNPNAGAEFAKLALAPNGSQRAADIFSRLMVMTALSSKKSPPE